MSQLFQKKKQAHIRGRGRTGGGWKCREALPGSLLCDQHTGGLRLGQEKRLRLAYNGECGAAQSLITPYPRRPRGLRDRQLGWY